MAVWNDLSIQIRCTSGALVIKPHGNTHGFPEVANKVQFIRFWQVPALVSYYMLEQRHRRVPQTCMGTRYLGNEPVSCL